MPPKPNDESEVPFALNRISPKYPASPPEDNATSILPSGSTVGAEQLACSLKRLVTLLKTTPPVPKLGSGDPSAFSRVTMQLVTASCGIGDWLYPATTILPSGCSVTPFAWA